MNSQNFLPLPDDQARQRWSAKLDTLLSAAGKRSARIAVALSKALGLKNPPDLKPWFTHFKQGEPAALRRIFGDHADSAKLRPALCLELDLTEAELSAALEETRFAANTFDEAPRWHPDFPTIGIGEITVEPSVLQHNERQPISLSAFALKIAEELRRKPHVVVRVCGPVGSGRHTAALLLVDKVESQVALNDAEFKRNSDGKSELPLVTRMVEELPQDSDGGRTLLIVPQIPDGNGEFSIRIQPWSPAQIMEIAKQLTARSDIDQLHADRFHAFAEAAGRDCELLGSDERPSAMLAQLAAAGRQGVPRDRGEARHRTIGNAWLLATTRLQPMDPLTKIGPEAWGAFWAHRIMMTKTPNWTELTVEDAVACASAATSVPALRVHRDADLGVLLDGLAKAGGKERDRARAVVDHRLALDQPDLLLKRFCDVGLLNQLKSGFQASDAVLACTVAAYGLVNQRKGHVAPAIAHSANGGRLTRELGCFGFSAQQFAIAVASWPGTSLLEASRLRIIHASGLPDVPKFAGELCKLTPQWAGVLLADVERAFDWRHLVGVVSTDDNARMLVAALRDLSVRGAGQFPDLEGETATQQLAKLADPACLSLIEKWRTVLTEVGDERVRQGDRHWNLALTDSEDEESGAERQVGRRLELIAPGQTLPWQVDDEHRAARFANCRDSQADWILALARRAVIPGDASAAWLAGEHLTFKTNETMPAKTPRIADSEYDSMIWRRVPGRLRLVHLVQRAIGTANERARAVSALAEISPAQYRGVAPIPEDAWPNWLRILRLQDRQQLTAELHARLTPFGDVEWLGHIETDDALRVAQELGIVEVLHAVVALPGQWLEGARAVQWAGKLQIIGPWGHWMEHSYKKPGDLDPSEGMWAELGVLERLAHKAAVALANCGQTQILQSRWKQGPGWKLPDVLRADFEILHAVHFATSATLEQLAKLEMDKDSCLAWLDGLATAVNSHKVPERYTMPSSDGATDPEGTLRKLAALAHADTTIAVATGAAIGRHFNWLATAMERERCWSWRQAVWTAPDALTPNQRLSCILIQALIFWSRREHLGPVLGWLQQLTPRSWDPSTDKGNFAGRPYAIAPGLDDLAAKARNRAFEALIDLQDAEPLRLWLENANTWPGDMPAFERRVCENEALLTLAFKLSTVRTAGRRRLLWLCAAVRPLPAWFAAAALAEDRQTIEAIASDLGRSPPVADLLRHLAETTPDQPTKSRILAKLREVEPNCREWPEHVAAWLGADPAPFADSEQDWIWRRDDGAGFQSLFRSAREVRGTKISGEGWRAGIVRLLGCWPEANRLAEAAVAAADQALANANDDDSWENSRSSRQSALYSAEHKVEDLQRFRLNLLDEVSDLGEHAIVESEIGPILESLRVRDAYPRVPTNMVLAWVERQPQKILTEFVADAGPLGDWVRQRSDSERTPRLHRTVANWYADQFSAALADADGADRIAIDNGLNHLDMYAPERLPRLISLLFKRLSGPWTVGVVWAACAHRQDELGAEIRELCMNALLQNSGSPE